MLFESLETDPHLLVKQVKVYQNGSKDFANYTLLKIIPDMNFNQIQKAIELRNTNKISIKKLRLFTVDGVEIFAEDLQFIKSGSSLYASYNGQLNQFNYSLGEEFDSTVGLSQYSILKKLGEGGFGRVLLGEHKVTKEKFAIKIVNTAKIGNAQDIDMVFREAEMLKSLVHKNIVQIFNCYTLPNMTVIFVMEYLEGGELLEFVQKNGRLCESDARVFFRQIAEAIQHCHRQALIHRDLKLENILLASQNKSTVKIVDFGIAGLATNFDISKIDAGSLKYMAPEIFTKKLQKIGAHIDIWALGVILYGMVFGHLPFNGDTQEEILNSIISLDFSQPLEGNVSNALKDLLTKIFDTDYLNRIKISDILYHKWCIGKDMDCKKKVALMINKSMGSGLQAGKSKIGNSMKQISIMNVNQSKFANPSNSIYFEGRQAHKQEPKILKLIPSLKIKKNKNEQEQVIETPSPKRLLHDSQKDLDSGYVPTEFQFLMNKIKENVEQKLEKKQNDDLSFNFSDAKMSEIERLQSQQSQNEQGFPQISQASTKKIFSPMNSSSGIPTRSSKKSGLITKNYSKVLEKYRNEKRGVTFRFKSQDFKDEYSHLVKSDMHRYEQKRLRMRKVVKSKDEESITKFKSLESELRSERFPVIGGMEEVRRKRSGSGRKGEGQDNKVKIGFYQKVQLKMKGSKRKSGV